MVGIIRNVDSRIKQLLAEDKLIMTSAIQSFVKAEVREMMTHSDDASNNAMSLMKTPSSMEDSRPRTLRRKTPGDDPSS